MDMHESAAHVSRVRGRIQHLNWTTLFLQLLLSMHCSSFHISNKPDQQQPKYIKRHCLEDNELKRLGLVLENCEDGVGRDGWELDQAEAKW